MLTKRLLARLLSRSHGSAFPRGTQEPRGARTSWRATAYLYTPLLSIFVFLFVMGVIFWTLTRREEQQKEDTLYRNVAWAQQQFRLSLTNTQDQVSALARDIAIGHTEPAALDAPTQEMLSSHPEIVALRWLTPAGDVRWDAMPAPAAGAGASDNLGATSTAAGAAKVPALQGPAAPIGRMRVGAVPASSSGVAPSAALARVQATAPASGAALAASAVSGATNKTLPNGASTDWQRPRLLPLLDAPLASALADARDSRRVGYSPVFFDAAGRAYLTQQTPIFINRSFVGAIVVVFSIDGMLHRELPTELSSRFKISILDSNDRELASSSSRPRLARDPYLDLALDPPGNGLSVRVYAYGQHGSAALLNNRLLWLVAGLSCFVLWSLWNVWTHTRQRFVAQQQLYDEASFRRAMENSVLVGMRVLDLQGRILYVNPAFCRMTGWDESDLVGTAPPYAYWPPESFTEMRRQIDMTLRGKAPSSGFEMRVRRKDGSTFHARMYVSPLIDGSGRQTGWMSSMTDISEPRRVREELTAAQQRFTTVLEGLDAAVSVLATDATQLLYANRYYRHIFGLRPQGHMELANALEREGSEEGGSDSIDMIDTYAGMPAAFGGDNDDPAREATVSQEVFVKSVDRWFDVRRQYIQWVDGHLAQMQIATDITARKLAEENARQQDEKLQFASRLSTMGEMASSLAHELNQPLAAISNYCSGASAMVRNNRASPEMLLGALEKTSQQAIRAGMIIKRIREFVKRSEPKRKEVRIGDIVADAIGLAEIETRRRGIRISTDMRGNLPAISVDPVLIEQVLVNLLKNAAEAMSEMRDTAPRSTVGPLDNVIQLVASNDPDMVRVSVIDHGPGVDEATAERLFEPFYSTKSDGMGMGLNICRSIIESHRGRLWVENNLASDGKITGCTFHCTLPIASARARDTQQADTYPFLNPTTLRENHE
ncbi:PAS domain S-box protein [Robbsia sp. KACC 23696]|uniref:PAS domain S-box protein n=1 Tax=Robbsia sp. KACC 23696 TaxID=3149231 RepID=UPI00325AB28B